MSQERVDLTGGSVKVIGNKGDVHAFRLSNPPDQEPVIAAGGEYEAEFVSQLRDPVPVVLDTTEVSNGILILPLVVHNGQYVVRRLNPRRTVLTVEVEVR